LILSAFKNRLKVCLGYHHMQTNPAVSRIKTLNGSRVRGISTVR